MGGHPLTASLYHSGDVEHRQEEASTVDVSTIGLDIAKAVFHARGSDTSGRMVFSRRLTGAKLLGFFAAQPHCAVALEACGGAHHWAREVTSLGYDVRLVPSGNVKPLVKRSKSDAIDAEALIVTE